MRLKHYNFASSLSLTIILSALFWSAFSIAHSAPLDQNQLTLTCKYEITTYDSQDYYTCTAINLTNNVQDSEITEINGKHLDEYDNSMVEAMIIEDQNLTFLPMKIGEAFEGLTRLEVRNSSLKEVLKENFEKMDLKVLKIEGNLVEKIPVDAFENLMNLEELSLSNNRIEDFEDDFFQNNEKVKFLSIDGNKIQNLSSNLLKNLPDLKKFSAKSNEIQELSEDLFKNNENLEGIFFTNNSLIKISPKIVQNLENLKHFDFFGNPCLKDLTTIDEISYGKDQLEGLFGTYCFETEEEETTPTDIPVEATEMPETTIQPSDNLDKSDEDVPSSTEATTDHPITSLDDTTVSTDLSTTLSSKTIEENTSVDSQNRNIDELIKKIEGLEKRIEVLSKKLKQTNSCGTEEDQIQSPTTERSESSTNAQVDNIEEKLKVNETTTIKDVTISKTTESPSTTDDQNSTNLIIDVESSTTTTESENFTDDKDAKIIQLENKIKDLEAKSSKVEELQSKTDKMSELEAEVKDLKDQNVKNLELIEETQKNLNDKLSKIGKLTEKIEDAFKKQNNIEEVELMLFDDLDAEKSIALDSDINTSKTNQPSTENSTTLSNFSLEDPQPTYLPQDSSTQQESPINMLESQISLLLSKIDKLILKNNQKSSKMTNLDESLKNCQDNKFLLELDSRINIMDMEDKNKTLEQFKTKLEACKNRTSDLRTAGKKYKICRESNVKYQNLIVELQNSQRDLQGEKVELLEKIGELEKEKDECKVDIEELKSQSNEQKEKIEELEKQIVEKNEKVEEIEKQNTELEEKAKELEGEISNQKEQIEQLEKQKFEQEEKIGELEDQSKAQDVRIEELKEQADKQITEIEDLKSEQNNLKSQIEVREDKVRNCNSEIFNYQNEVEVLKTQSSNLKIKSDNLENEAKNLRITIDELRSLNDNLEGQIDQLRGQIANLNAVNYNKTVEISFCRHAYQEFKKSNEDLFYKNKELSTQHTHCQEDLLFYSSFPINCEIENFEDENVCMAKSVVAMRPNMHVSNPKKSNLKRLQILNSKFRFFTNSIFEHFVDLKTLEIVNSELLSLTDPTIQSDLLINLRIEGNFIQQIPNEAFTRVSNLQNLILAKNEIENIQDEAFRGLSNLRKLDLRENKISVLNINVFHPLQALTQLSLSSNKLRDLPGGLLAYQRYIQIVMFDYNKISYIGEELLDYTNNFEKGFFQDTCVGGNYKGIEEIKLRIRLYCQRKN